VVRNRPSLTSDAVRGTEAQCYLADDALSLKMVDAVLTPQDALTYSDSEWSTDADPSQLDITLETVVDGKLSFDRYVMYVQKYSAASYGYGNNYGSFYGGAP
jgi:hypothetical protein